MNSSWSKSGSFIRPARQSAFACSIRSFDDDTKFHSMKRGPTGAPPSAMTVDGATAVKEAAGPGENTAIRGGLGQFEAKYLMTLALANAGRLSKYGA